MTARRTFVNSFPSQKKCPSHVQNLFYTDKIESIEWQDVVTRQRTGDCLWIHPPHSGFCDLTLSSHQNFLIVEDAKLLWVSCEVFVLHGYDWIH